MADQEDCDTEAVQQQVSPDDETPDTSLQEPSTIKLLKKRA